MVSFDAKIDGNTEEDRARNQGFAKRGREEGLELNVKIILFKRIFHIAAC